MTLRKIIAALFLLIPLLAQTQTDIRAMTKKEIRKARPSWIALSYGLDFDNFRDLGTSPLYYSGTLHAISLGEIRKDARRFTSLGGTYAFGNNRAPGGISTVRSILFHFSRLYHLPTKNWERWNLKVGGTFAFTGNQRVNSRFGNTRLGVEAFGNLMASGRLEWDISRKEAKQKKVLFLKFHLPERRKNLAFQLNLGLLNANWRPRFAYLGHDGALNQDLFFSRHQFNFFDGFRASTALEYTWFLPNRNGLRLGYRWDTMTSGGEFNRFAMAHHLIQFSFLFNTK